MNPIEHKQPPPNILTKSAKYILINKILLISSLIFLALTVVLIGLFMAAIAPGWIPCILFAMCILSIIIVGIISHRNKVLLRPFEAQKDNVLQAKPIQKPLAPSVSSSSSTEQVPPPDDDTKSQASDKTDYSMDF